MKMTEMGKPVYYYENTEGGHSAGANLNQSALHVGTDVRVSVEDAGLAVRPRPSNRSQEWRLHLRWWGRLFVERRPTPADAARSDYLPD